MSPPFSQPVYILNPIGSMFDSLIWVSGKFVRACCSITLQRYFDRRATEVATRMISAGRFSDSVIRPGRTKVTLPGRGDTDGLRVERCGYMTFVGFACLLSLRQNIMSLCAVLHTT
jgi:hypothetical protein